MENKNNSEKLLRDLFGLCASGKGSVKNILQFCYEYFARPVIVMDMSYSVIAQCPETETGDPIWDSQLKNHVTDTSAVYKYYTDNMIDALLTSDEPVLVDWGVVSDCPRLAMVIRSGDEVLGTVGIHCPKGSLKDSDYEDLKAVSQALSIVMNKSRSGSALPSLRGENTLVDTMMSVLFQGKIRTQQDLELWQNNVRLELHPDFCVLAMVPSVSSSSQTFLLANIRKKLSSQYKGMYTTFHDDVVYILMTRQRKERENRQLIERISDILRTFKEYRIPFGISDVFSSLLDIESYRYQAVRAAQLSNLEDTEIRSHFYCENVISDILSGGIGNMPKNCYLHPALDTLICCDRSQNTAYYETLVTYIDTMCSAKATCDKLFIHRNTLAYRLNRIEELTGISLSDANTFLHLMCSLYISRTGIEPLPPVNS